MTSGGAEALKAAVRRSLPVIVGLLVLGVVAVNVFTHLAGPKYEASARVLISTTPLSQVITGTEPAFVDPDRVQQTALGIADSPRVYAIAARETGRRFGRAGELRGATAVAAEPNSDLLSFTAHGSEPRRAVGIVNAVASAYIVYRGQLFSAQIRSTIRQIRSQLESLPPDSGQRRGLQEQLDKLSVLQNLNSGDAQLVQRAGTAAKTSPALIKDTILGFSIGLVIALLVVALREAIDTAVRSEADVEDLLAAPVLASIGRLPRRAKIVAHGRYEPMFGDAYALLAAQLVRPDDRALMLAVTSAVDGEGKTTTAANLAVAVARRGKDVLLADFDFRKPMLAQAFGIPPDVPGALEVRAGTATLEQTLWNVSLDGPVPVASLNGSAPQRGDAADGFDGPAGAGSLRVLPAGIAGAPEPAAHAAWLGSMLRALQARSDVVILDTPPALLTVEMAELSRRIDSVVVVVRQGRVSHGNLRTLGRKVRTWGGEVAGAVITDAPNAARKSYYGAG
ncbi:MAG TPA: hypothetical protein VNB64_09380 [Solirubrobacteraceae bacterium]|nr:hypothetical protein [Solirubrobacteraceae bacterium]